MLVANENMVTTQILNIFRERQTMLPLITSLQNQFHDKRFVCATRLYSENASLNCMTIRINRIGIKHLNTFFDNKKKSKFFNKAIENYNSCKKIKGQYYYLLVNFLIW